MNKKALKKQKILALLILIALTTTISGCGFEPDISTIEAPQKIGPQPFATFQVNHPSLVLDVANGSNKESMLISGYEVKYEPELWNCE